MAWIGNGMRGNAVKDIQGLLWQAGLYDGAIDGRFGMKTEAAVRSWQNEVGVLPDGYWGQKTLDATVKKLSEFNGPEPLPENSVPYIPNVNNQKGLSQ
jgi:peptidoglycan hydrolase-like protein with peptidoglycan-binding domain